MGQDLARRRMPIVGRGEGVWSFIHVDDAARATVAALDRDVPGIFNVVDDDPAPICEWLPDLALLVQTRPGATLGDALDAAEHVRQVRL